MFSFLILWLGWDTEAKVVRREEEVFMGEPTPAQWFLSMTLLPLQNIQRQDTHQQNTTVYSVFGVWPKSMKYLKVILKQIVVQAFRLTPAVLRSLYSCTLPPCELLYLHPSHGVQLQQSSFLCTHRNNEMPMACYLQLFTWIMLLSVKARPESSPITASVCKTEKELKTSDYKEATMAAVSPHPCKGTPPSD